MPVSDADHMLRTATDGLLNLAASVETTTGVHVGEGPIQGMKLRIYCPLGAGSTPTLDIVVQEGETLGGTYYATGAVPQITAAGTYEFHFHWTMPYLRLVSTLTGTGADFGLATVGLTPGQIETT